MGMRRITDLLPLLLIIHLYENPCHSICAQTFTPDMFGCTRENLMDAIGNKIFALLLK